MKKQRNHTRHNARHHVGLILALAGLMIGVTLISSRLASAQTIGGTWTVTGRLNASRNGHTATLLPNGKAVTAGRWLLWAPPLAKVRGFRLRFAH